MISLIKRGVTKVTPLLFLLSFKALSQPNLVPNPSMEVLPPDTCLPGNLIDIQQQFPTALLWLEPNTFNGSTDYFNRCRSYFPLG
ncbi:MAG: hypothetical protein ACK46R_03675, partial [Bacteroidota bacterium]